MNKRKQASSDAEKTKVTQNFECLWKDWSTKECEGACQNLEECKVIWGLAEKTAQWRVDENE